MARNTNVNLSLQAQIGPDGLAIEAPVIAYTEKIIMEEQLQLKKYIEENYSKIRDVERELSNLSMDVKLTAGPRKAALEHMRKKIEMSTDRIHVAKLKEEQARKAWEAALKAVKDEEEIKQKLCEDLNNLVQESSNTQLARLEELKRRLEALNPSRSSTSAPYDGNPMGTAQSGATQDASAIPGTTEPADGFAGKVSIEGGNGEVVPSMNGTNQQSVVDGAGRERKKIPVQGRGKGIGAIPRGRGSGAVPGWTGAGFDVVDGRS